MRLSVRGRTVTLTIGFLLIIIVLLLLLLIQLLRPPPGPVVEVTREETT